jgi:hypothetical protein
MTEFLHDVVRKQNLDNFMRANADTNSDWENYVDPWGNIGLTQLTVDWMATQVREPYQVTDSGELGGGPF